MLIRDQTDDLFYAMEASAFRLQTAKDLQAGQTGKTGTVGVNWHQIDTNVKRAEG